MNESGIEAFKRRKSLSRETMQNVLDARSQNAIAEQMPAIVRFDLVLIPREDFPDIDGLRATIQSCLDYTLERFKHEQDRQSNGVPFFRDALDFLNQDCVPALRIRDENTTGLRGADHDRDQPFYRLIRGQGYSRSEGVGGGTYGIGQRAPFAFSRLRSMLYYTRLEDGSEALIAKSILCTHPDANGDLTQSKGWWCEVPEDPTAWRTLRRPEAIPEYYRREVVGTDLYVLGYDGENWQHEVTRNTLHNFFAAIQYGLLEVEIGGRTINSATVLDELERAVADARAAGERKRSIERGIGAAWHYLNALRNPVGGKPFFQTIDKLGKVEMYVGRDDDAPNRIAWMRKPRILVYDSGSARLSRYAAVVVCDSEEGNAYLAALEDPAHERWHPDEARNWTNAERKTAARVLTDLRRFVNATLESLRDKDAPPEQDVPDLGRYLPAEEDDEDEATREGGHEPSSQVTNEETGIETGADSSPRINRSSRSNRGANVVRPETHRRRRRRGRKRQRKKDQKKRQELAEVRFRAFADQQAGNEVYEVVLQAAADCTGDLTLRAVGEDEARYSVEVASAIDLASQRSVECSGPVLKALRLKAGQEVRLRVKLVTPVPVSLGVG